MPRYKVKDGQALPHGGRILDAGSILELPRHVGQDTVVRDFVEEVDAAGEPVAPADPSASDLERFRPHERIGMLQATLFEAEARVARLKALIADQQDIIDDEATAPAAASPIAFAPVHAPKGEE